MGAGCDVQAKVTVSGDNCSLLCENGCDFDGIVMSGDDGILDGGGWNSLSHGGSNTDHGIDCTGSRNIVKDMSFQSLAGVAGTYMGIYVRTGTFNTVRNCRVIDSDAVGIYVASADNLIVDNVISDADEDGIFVGGARNRIIGNYVVQIPGWWTMRLASGADNCLIVANILRDGGSGSLNFLSGADYNTYSGNRFDGTITDSGTGNGTQVTQAF